MSKNLKPEKKTSFSSHVNIVVDDLEDSGEGALSDADVLLDQFCQQSRLTRKVSQAYVISHLPSRRVSSIAEGLEFDPDLLSQKQRTVGRSNTFSARSLEQSNEISATDSAAAASICASGTLPARLRRPKVHHDQLTVDEVDNRTEEDNVNAHLLLAPHVIRRQSTKEEDAQHQRRTRDIHERLKSETIPIAQKKAFW